MSVKTMKKHRLDYLPITSLRFDPENPRLNGKGGNYTQYQIFDILERDFDLLPIATSMAENGYFDEEPLMVVEKKNEKDVFFVVEGNRRLAALKALIDPNFQARSPNRHTYEKLAKILFEPLDEVPVMKSENREELIPRLGFRHIAGIMKWESLSKAVYIHSLVEKSGNQDFDTIGQDLSIDSANVKKNYLSYQIYLQAREQGIETKEIEDNFGVWYTALGNVNIQKFIGYNPRAVQKEKLKSPVPKGKMKELAEFVGYIFGTAEVKKAIRESRDLQKLGQVLSSKDALDYLRNGGSFNDACSLIEGEEKTLLRILGRATLNLAESLQYIYRHSNDQEVKEAIKECGDAFLEVLKSFPEIKQAFVGQLGKDY